MRCSFVHLAGARVIVSYTEPPAGSHLALATATRETTSTDLAVSAARTALSQALISPTRPAELFHVTGQTPPGRAANVATQIAPRLDLNTRDQLLLTIASGRTAVLDAIHLAAGKLELAGRVPTPEAPSTVVITASDAPHVDRGGNCGTAGGAVVLSRDDGALKLLSITAHHEPAIARLHDEQADPAHIRERTVTAAEEAIAAVLDEAWDKKDVTASDVDYFIVPASLDGVEAEAFIERLGGLPDTVQTVTGEDRCEANLGAADLLVSLGTVDGVNENLQRGELVLLAAVDGGKAAAALLRVE